MFAANGLHTFFPIIFWDITRSHYSERTRWKGGGSCLLEGEKGGRSRLLGGEKGGGSCLLEGEKGGGSRLLEGEKGGGSRLLEGEKGGGSCLLKERSRGVATKFRLGGGGQIPTGGDRFR